MRISDWSSDVCSSDLATGVLRDTSFDTISATGAHGASPHYHSTPESNAELKPGDLYLVDSGGQYEDGTTDVTRVLPVGEPTHEMKDRFTRVLKGNIALDTALFPRGTNGGQLDGFARRPLWEAGLRSEEHTSALPSLMRHSYPV